MAAIRGVTQHFRGRWPEWCLSWLLFAQSLQLLSAHELASNRIYVVLASMVHEKRLGTISLVLGIVWIVALALNGTFVAFRRISPWVRAGVAMCTSGYWALWSITLYQATGPVTSVSYINHAFLSIMAVMCCLMAAREIGVADERAARGSTRS